MSATIGEAMSIYMEEKMPILLNLATFDLPRKQLEDQITLAIVNELLRTEGANIFFPLSSFRRACARILGTIIDLILAHEFEVASEAFSNIGIPPNIIHYHGV